MLLKDVFQKIRDRNPSNSSQFNFFYLYFVDIFKNLSTLFFITNSIALPAKSAAIGKFLNTDFLDGITNYACFSPFGH